MPKSKKPKSKKPSDAWKDLVRRHKRGPKRVKLPGKRRPKGAVPLNHPSAAKVVQLIQDGGLCGPKKVVVVMFREHFERLHLSQGKTYTVVPGALTLAARRLLPALGQLTHNEMVLKRPKEMKLAGICNVIAGDAKTPNATIHITRTREDQERSKKTLEHIHKLFSRSSGVARQVSRDAEYI